MKYLVALLCLAPLACASTVRGDRATAALDRELVDVVAFETGCPHERIEIVDRPNAEGRRTFAVEACGREMEYQRTDAVFHSTDSQL
jgi:hypothetical protein